VIYFLIPVYNEVLNITELTNNLKVSLPGYNKFFLFVDDCSTDGTTELLAANLSGEKYFVIKKDQNYGPGDSFNRGFEWILQNSKSAEDIIITMEADNTSDIEILSNMFKISGLGFDLVLASVFAQGGGFEKTTLIRKLISFTINVLLRLVFDIRVLTLSSFYRVYSIKLIQAIKDKYVTIVDEKGFICMIEILIKAIKLKSNIIEVPMKLYSTRRKGKSKMKILRTSFGYLKFLFTHKY
jgi:dolichol-phosphate mannosyltransferase